MALTLFGIVISVRARQPLKHWSPIFSTPSLISMLFNSSHILNAEPPSQFDTLDGSSMVAKVLYALKGSFANFSDVCAKLNNAFPSSISI
jgi:hypothetical protein